MSKVLVIYAHPESAKQSSSYQLYQHFLTAYTAKNPEDEIIVHNVSEFMPFPLNKLSLSIFNKHFTKEALTNDEKEFNDARQEWVNEFINADKYVFVNPMYNLFMPAEMKSYIDVIMQAGQTFHYNADGSTIGDLHNKKAIHLQANGGNYHNELTPKDSPIDDLADKYLKMILNMIGVTDYSAVFAEGMDKDPMHANEILAAAFDQAKLAGEKF